MSRKQMGEASLVDVARFCALLGIHLEHAKSLVGSSVGPLGLMVTFPSGENRRDLCISSPKAKLGRQPAHLSGFFGEGMISHIAPDEPIWWILFPHASIFGKCARTQPHPLYQNPAATFKMRIPPSRKASFRTAGSCLIGFRTALGYPQA